MRKLLILWMVLTAWVGSVSAQSVRGDRFILNGGPCALVYGAGSPEGAVTGNVCDKFISATGELWTKMSGTGNTGWSMVPRLDAANIFTANPTISGTEAYIYFYESDQGVDQKRWRWNATAGTMKLQTINDAGSTIQNDIFSVNRSGTAIFNSTVSAVNGFRVNGGGSAGSFLRGDGNNYTASTLTLPNTATANRVPYATATNAWGESANLTFNGTTLTSNALTVGSGGVTSSLLPTTTDTFDLGAVNKIWNQAFISQLNAIVFAQTTATLFGGYSIIGKQAGSVSADIASAATTVNFGQTMTPGDWILIRAHDTSGVIRAEYMTVGSLVSGTTYNVTRDVAGANSPDPTWASGTPYLGLGTTGDGRIELLAFDGKPRISFLTQGATAAAANDRGIIGRMDGYYGYTATSCTGSTPCYGAAFGDPSASNITIDPSNGVRGRIGTTDYFKLAGSTFTVGTSGGNRLQWDGTNLTLVSANATIDANGISLAQPSHSSYAPGAAYRFDRSGTPLGQPGDVFAIWTVTDLTNQFMNIENSPVGTTGTFPCCDTDARVTITATGWDMIGTGGAAYPAAAMGVRSNAAGGSVTAFISVRDTISLFGALTQVSNTFRTGYAVDLTAYTQADANTLAGGTNGETLAVVGSSSFTNQNFYIGGVAARKATLSVTTSGTQGGQLAVFVKPDSAADVSGAAYWAANGGYVVGTPTGASKGLGTINAQAVYDDNTLLTDWVFDLYYEGRTSHRIPPGGRLYTLGETAVTSQNERRLPWMPTRESFEQERNIGGMISRLWFGQEQQQLYIQQLEARIAALERR